MFKAPKHKQLKRCAAPLSKELREKYKRRTVNVRKADIVKVVRGKFKDHAGEVMNVNPTKHGIYVDGVTIKKADGTDVPRAIDPSNVVITQLFLEDKKRRAMLSRKLEVK